MITLQTRVIDALKASPAIRNVFGNYGLECPGCKGSQEDTIAHVIKNNGLDGDAFLRDLNTAR